MLADFSYEQTSKMTGGSMMAMLRLAGPFAKQAREPQVTSVLLRGNRMAHIGAHASSVVDLDAETITTIDHDRKTYSVMTFADMKKVMEQAQGKVQEVNADFKASVKETGKTRIIEGLDTKEVVLTVTTEATDPKSGQKAKMDVVSEMWLAATVPGAADIRDFSLRMAKKIDWSPGGGGMFGPRPELARGFAGLMKEAAKLEGVPVLQVVKMGGMDANMTPEQRAQMAEAQKKMAEAEANRQNEPQPERPTIGGALSGALGGRFGGLGRKKKQEAPKEEPKQEQAKTDSTPAPAESSDSLMEMTIESRNFSSAALDASRFTVPSGYKQVENEALRRTR